MLSLDQWTNVSSRLFLMSEHCRTQNNISEIDRILGICTALGPAYNDLEENLLL